MRHRSLPTLALAALLAGGLSAQETPPKATAIPWVLDVDAAFAKARAENKQVLFCIMMEGEVACDRMLATTYKDPAFLAKVAEFVPVPCSRAGKPQFEGVTVAEQRACEQVMRTKILAEEVVVAPQHVICAPDRTLTSRKRYEMSTSELVSYLNTAARRFRGEPDEPTPPADTPAEKPAEGEGAKPAPAKKDDAAVPPRAASQLLAELEKGSAEERLAATEEILDTGDEAAIDLLVEFLLGKKAPPTQRFDLIRAAGRTDYREAAPAFARLLAVTVPRVRHGTVVTLEEMGSPRVVTALLAHWKTEKEAEIKADVLRALGPTGKDSEEARKLLLEQLDSQKVPFRVAAAIALGQHAKDREEVHTALAKRYRKESGVKEVKLAILYAFYTARDESAGKLVAELAAAEEVDELRTVGERVASGLGVEPKDPQNPPEERGGGRGGRGGRGGGRGRAGDPAAMFGGQFGQFMLLRSFYPLFEKDPVQRRVVTEMLDRMRRR